MPPVWKFEHLYTVLDRVNDALVANDLAGITCDTNSAPSGAMSLLRVWHF